MKKLLMAILAIAIICLSVAAGCKPTSNTGSSSTDSGADTSDVSDDTSDDSAVDTSGTDDSGDVAPDTPVMSKQLQSLMAGLDKVESYAYAYQSGTSEARNYKVKGDKIRMVLMTKKKWKEGEFYNEILVDKAKKTAYGFCTDRAVCNDKQREYARAVSFTEYMPTMLPYDYSRSITHGDIVGSENIENRPATIVEFQDDSGNTIKVSVNNYYGVAMRIVTETPTGIKKEVMFTSMSWNSVKDVDVEFPKEIIRFED